MAPSPKKATATPSVPAVACADRRADRRGDAAADEAVRAEQADRGVVEMHRAAAAAAAAVVLAVKLGHQHARVHALGQRMAVAAMGRGDPVGRPQVGADARRGRLLADVEMQEAGRLALAAGDLRRELELPQQHHGPVEPDHRRPRRGRRAAEGGSTEARAPIAVRQPAAFAMRQKSRAKPAVQPPSIVRMCPVM